VIVGSSPRRREGRERKSYPPFWERAVPVLVAVFVIVIVALIVIASMVALGFISG
jgi:hypothetical protein